MIGEFPAPLRLISGLRKRSVTDVPSLLITGPYTGVTFTFVISAAYDFLTLPLPAPYRLVPRLMT